MAGGAAPEQVAATSALALLPAVDVAGGRAAQVVDRGSDDPAAVARSWVDQGAQWVHMVDLDRAFGRGQNADLLVGLIRDLPVPVQLSGGIADRATLRWAAATTADRVVLASSALADQALVRYAFELLAERLVVAIDVRQGHVVSRGTSMELGPVTQVLAQHPVVVEEVAHVLVADAARDGRRSGADLALFSGVAEQVAARVTASGGIATLDDLTALRALTGRGVTHAVLGAALYHRAFTLAEAIEATR